MQFSIFHFLFSLINTKLKQTTIQIQIIKYKNKQSKRGITMLKNKLFFSFIILTLCFVLNQQHFVEAQQIVAIPSTSICSEIINETSVVVVALGGTNCTGDSESFVRSLNNFVVCCLLFVVLLFCCLFVVCCLLFCCFVVCLLFCCLLFVCFCLLLFFVVHNQHNNLLDTLLYVYIKIQ